MDAVLYVEILHKTLLPFIAEKYPMGHRFMQDNDPKHTSRLAQEFFMEKGINWWKTAPESPDLNPMENMWHELKEFIRRETKPRTKEELVEGIKLFWRTVDVPKCTRLLCIQWQMPSCYVCTYIHVYMYLFFCCRYIRHLSKVIPKVLEVNGEPTGY